MSRQDQSEAAAGRFRFDAAASDGFGASIEAAVSGDLVYLVLVQSGVRKGAGEVNNRLIRGPIGILAYHVGNLQRSKRFQEDISDINLEEIE